MIFDEQDQLNSDSSQMLLSNENTTTRQTRTSFQGQHRTFTKSTDMKNDESNSLSVQLQHTDKIREFMQHVCQRLTKNLDMSTFIPIVDTHCHLDLIFDR
jgi:hypothetical protein